MATKTLDTDKYGNESAIQHIFMLICEQKNANPRALR